MVLYNLEGCLKTFRPLARQGDFFGQNFSKEANITKKLRNACNLCIFLFSSSFNTLN